MKYEMRKAKKIAAKRAKGIQICTICGREITDPLAIRRGIGSECWKKIQKKDAPAPKDEDFDDEDGIADSIYRKRKEDEDWYLDFKCMLFVNFDIELED